MALGSTSLSSPIKWQDHVQTLIDEYRTLVADNRWRPVVKSVKDGPNFGIKAAAALQQSSIDNKATQGTQHRLTTGTGNPPSDKQPPKTDEPKPPRILQEERFKLLMTPPANGVPTKAVKIEGVFRPCSWCSICWRWFYHEDSGHAAYVERNPEQFAATNAKSSSKGLPPASSTAAALVSSCALTDDNDDFINICSLARN